MSNSPPATFQKYVPQSFAKRDLKDDAVETNQVMAIFHDNGKEVKSRCVPGGESSENVTGVDAGRRLTAAVVATAG